MNPKFPLVLTALMLRAIVSPAATIHYVDLNSANPLAPFTDWGTAATNIQDAIDAAVDGDQVLVTNGVYQVGGKVMAGDLTNRVTLDKVVVLQSVNGPWATVIKGGSLTNGTTAIRCAWLTNGAALVGFTIQAGATRTTGDVTNLLSGGGVWCASASATVANCLIASNTAYRSGGGMFQGTINNSLLSSNRTYAQSYGGGAYAAMLNSCTVVSNVGGGTYWSRLTNCIVYYNDANNNYTVQGPGYLSYCCTTPLPSGGTGNFITAPQLFADGLHLLATSPCVGAGVNQVTGTDIFGRDWSNPPALGCVEYRPGPLVTTPQVKLTGDPVGFTVGNVAIYSTSVFGCWWLKDGVPLQDNGHFGSTQTTNLVALGVGFADGGDYQLVVTNSSGAVTSAVARVVVHCVDAAGVNPVAPYSNWATAATNIQDAIESASEGEVVVVTNGLYATGGKSKDGVLTNRVTLDKMLTLQSVNGATNTIIQGGWDPQMINGPASVRCVWMTNATTVSGFTLRGGATAANTNVASAPLGGGALGSSAYSPSHNGWSNIFVANCILELNSAGSGGGGAYNVVLINSILRSNTVGSSTAQMTGGAAYSCYLRNCRVLNNFAGGGGGGVAGSDSISRNCVFMGNTSGYYGGAAYYGSLINCTITHNSILPSSGGSGAGVYLSSLVNCIVWGNILSRQGYPGTNYASSTLAYCCADPLPSGSGNIAADPQVLADGIHLAATSPCRGAGTNSVVIGSDLDGQSWSNPPSIGCDEWHPEPAISSAPVVQVGMPMFGLTASAIIGGQSPFTCYWSKDGVPLQDDAHHSNSSTPNLVVLRFRPEDAGVYQVVASNAFGMATSPVTQVVIHAVDAASANPVPPYSTWATAAETIQEAVDVALPGEIVLVTNGVYATGGKVMAGDLTNRVALDKALTVISVNGAFATAIQGAWDPFSTNGPGAVRCAWLADGAVLNGFTLQGGATRSSSGVIDFSMHSGGGAWCGSANGVVSDCVLSNNMAYYGGGISYGTLNNSFVIGNVAGYGGGAYQATLNNCTVVKNSTTWPFPNHGGGTLNCIVRNSIVLYNAYYYPYDLEPDNYYYDGGYFLAKYTYSCTYPLISGTGNVDGNSTRPQFVDLFHLAVTSPLRGAGSALYASGTDLDGEAWATPPAMGCDEVIPSNLAGPLSLNLVTSQTNLLAAQLGWFWGIITGRASQTQLSYGDGASTTNWGGLTGHRWGSPGDYTVTFTAFNTDNPGGVSTNLTIHVLPLLQPQLNSVQMAGSNFVFEFTGQPTASYTVQFATNLTAPASWRTLQSFYASTGQIYQIQDPLATNGTRFYRVQESVF